MDIQCISVKDERPWDLFYDIIFPDPAMTHHFSQYQLMKPHRRSRSAPFREWWGAFRSYMGQMFDKPAIK
jgi:truncated hemoglobin YjbI